MLQNKEIRRGDDVDLVFTTTTDYSTKKIIFIAKRDKGLTSARMIEKKNTLGGGADTELEVDATSITVHLLEGNTQVLEDEFLYFDIFNDTDNETLFHGKLWILADVQSPYDSGSLPSSELPILNKSIYIEIVNGVITQENYYGFDTDPTSAVSQDASFDILTITSDSELDLAGIPHSNNEDWDTITHTVDEIEVSWSIGKFTGRTVSFHWQYYSDSEIGQSTPITYTRTYGTTAQRPTFDSGSNIGFTYFDTTLNSLIVWSGSAWVVMAEGSTNYLGDYTSAEILSQEIEGTVIGDWYFNTDLNSPYFWNGTSWV